MKKHKTFETERLHLRPTSEEDGALVVEVMNHPGFIRYVGDRGIRTAEDGVVFIRQRMLPQLQRLGYSSYTLIDKETGQKLGVCGLYDRKGVRGIDLGFGLTPSAEGQGFAYEAASRLKQAAFEDFGLQELAAITDPVNEASQALLGRLGFQRLKRMWLEDEELLLFIYREAALRPAGT